VTEGDPAVVICTAAVRGGTFEGQVRFCAKVALAVGTCRFIVPLDLAIVAEGDFVVCPSIIRQG